MKVWPTLYYSCFYIVDVLPFLVRASICLDEGVAHTLLQLLLCALCGTPSVKGTQPQDATADITTTSPNKQKKDKDKDKNEGDISH